MTTIYEELVEKRNGDEKQELAMRSVTTHEPAAAKLLQFCRLLTAGSNVLPVKTIVVPTGVVGYVTIFVSFMTAEHSINIGIGSTMQPSADELVQFARELCEGAASELGDSELAARLKL